MSISRLFIRRKGRAPVSRAENQNQRRVMTMRFMMMIKGNKDTEAGVMPSEKILAAMREYNTRERDLLLERARSCARGST